MQVTYTHLDNTVTTFTANTAVYGNIHLGNSITPADNVRYKILANTAGSGVTANPTISKQGDHMFEYVSHGVVGYITDYGFSLWATERLSTADKATFLSQSSSWNDSKDNTTDSNFVYWWGRFSTDPHVTITNT